MDGHAASLEELQFEISELEESIAKMTLEAEHFESTKIWQEGHRLHTQLAASRRQAIARKKILVDKLRAILNARQRPCLIKYSLPAYKTNSESRL